MMVVNRTQVVTVQGQSMVISSNNNVYQTGSKIPNKGGQLVAQLLRKLKNKEVTLPIKRQGFYMHKRTGTIHFEVEMDRNVTKVKATLNVEQLPPDHCVPQYSALCQS